MASGRQYLEYILEQLSGLSGVSHRAMMGEFILYYGGKVIGGIYDDRLMVKPTASARALMPKASMEPPYSGAKDMLVVDNVDDRELLKRLVVSVYEELPDVKRRSGKGSI